MEIFLQVLGAIPNVIFKIAAVLSSGVGLFWIWFWFNHVWRWWRRMENPEGLPDFGVLLLALGWFFLAGVLWYLQRRVNDR